MKRRIVCFWAALTLFFTLCSLKVFAAELWRFPLDTYKYIGCKYNCNESHHSSPPHKGLDIPADEGTPIKATQSGWVVRATYGNSEGNYVMLRHDNGLYSAYKHMSKYIVNVDDWVTQGQVIGYVGNTGYSSGPHLHFEMGTGAYYSTTINPQDNPYAIVDHKNPIPNTEAPSSSILSVNKTLFAIGENIHFSAFGEGARGYTIGIDRNGTRVYTADINTSFDISFNEPGDYSAYVSAWNSAGALDSARVYFGIHGTMDIGTDFYAYIFNTAKWLPIEVTSSNNVVLANEETGMQNQLWKFTRMNDGSYKITSLLDGKVLDVDCAKTEPETNIKTEIFTDNPAQYWEIFGTSGNYKLKAKCTDCVIDCNGKIIEGQYNIQNYTYNNTGAQNLQIYKVSETFALGKPQNIGENFIAKIINIGSKLPLSKDVNRNIILDNDDSCNMNQFWEFTLLSNGSYKIVALSDYNALDVEYSSNTIEANIKSNLYLNHDAQHWNIYGKEGNYKLKANCTDYVLDVSGGIVAPGARLQTYTYNDTNAQKFAIDKKTLVIFNPTDGIVNESQRIINYGSTYDKLPLPQRAGYEFVGWYTENGDVVTSDSIAPNTTIQTLYAQWESLSPYTESIITKSGTKLIIDTKVHNIAEPYDILIVGYKNNKFVSMKRVPHNEQNAPYTLEGDMDKIKVMVWNGMSSLAPLCTSEEIPSTKWTTE